MSMNALEIFGIYDWAVQKTYDNCKHIVEIVNSVLTNSGTSDKELSALDYFFDLEVSDYFDKLQKEKGPFKLESFGDNLQKAMLEKTALTLNSQSVLRNINLNNFGYKTDACNRLYDFDLFLDCELCNTTTSKLNEKKFENLFCESCIYAIATHFVLSDRFEFTNTLASASYKEDIEEFAIIIKEKFNDQSLSIKHLGRAANGDIHSLSEIVKEVNSYMQDIKEERIAQEIEE